MPGISALTVPREALEKNASKQVSVKDFVFSVLRTVLGPPVGYTFLLLPNIFLTLNVISAWATVGYQKYLFHQRKQFLGLHQGNLTNDEPAEFERGFLEMLHMKDYLLHLGVIGFISIAIYIPACSYLYYKYEVKQRHNAKDWKLQPDKFLTPELFNQGLWDAGKGLAVVIFVHGSATCYGFNNGPLSKVYFNFSDQPIWWNILQLPVLIAYQDFIAYWYHRFYHIPALYKIFHKYHHKYKSPTVFLALAVQPLELIHFFANFLYPAMIFPVYLPTFVLSVAYMLNTPFIDHTGHKGHAPWFEPWRVDPKYHDDHHRLGWGNFGYHSSLWDQVFNTGVRIRVATAQTEESSGKKDS